jgi:hypothetical protein
MNSAPIVRRSFTWVLLVAPLFLAVASGGSPPQVAFPDVISLKTDRGPSQVAIADLNLDARLDLVTANALGSSVSVLLGRGDGSFSPAGRFAAADAKPYGLAFGRFNEDAYPDLVTAAAAGSALVVLMNDGSGGFAPPVTVPVDKATIAVAAGDLNGDRLDDIAAAHPDGEEVALYLNQGQGRFSKGGSLSALSRALLIADLNKDGKPDLVSANDAEGTVSVFLARDRGEFSPAKEIKTSAEPQTLHAADLNGDGWMDLVAASPDADSVSILTNRGDGSFEHTGDVAVRQPSAVGTTDIDGDGRLDLVVAERESGAVAVLFQEGGSFRPAIRFPAGGDHVTSLAVADLNRDGSPDIATANMASDTVSVLLKGVRVPRIEKFSPASTARVQLVKGGLDSEIRARFNTELDADSLAGGVLVYASQSGYHQAELIYDERDHTVTVKPHGAKSKLQAPGRVVDFTPGEQVAVSFTKAVRSRVGIPIGNSPTFLFTVASPQGSGQFVEAARIDCVKIPGTLRAADMDNDGRIDIVALCREVDGIRVHFNSGGASFAHHDSVFLPTKGYGPWDLVPADFNRDGKIDIAVVNTFSSDLTIIYNEGNRKFSEPMNLPSGAGPMSLASSDLDGDGYLDVVTVTKGFPAVLVFINDRKGGFKEPVSYHVAPSPYDLTAKDLNGDGSPDLVMTNLESDRGTILMNNGDGSFRKGEEFPLQLAKALTEEPVDVDNDDQVDIVTVNTASDDISIFLNRGKDKFEQQANVPVGLTPTDKVFGDFNGDGFVDMAITLDGGKVTMLLNNGNGTFRRADTLAVGKNPTSPVSADFNGDGTLDLVVANQYSFDLSVLINLPKKGAAGGAGVETMRREP